MTGLGFGKRYGRVIGAVVVLTCAGSCSTLQANPLTPFRDEAQAQRHCPDDRVVWLDFRKGVYYAKTQKRYALGFDGSFVCLSEARGNHYRRSYLGLR